MLQSGELCGFLKSNTVLENEMKVTLDIKITAKDLFNFNIRQAYKGMQGFLSVLLPVLLFAYGVNSIGKVDVIYTFVYFALGVVFLVYVPFSLWKRANKVVNDPNNALSKTLHYEFREDAIRVEVEDQNVEFKWENIFMMKKSGKLLLVYTNRINAYILPLEQVGDKYTELSELAKSKLEKYRLKL